MIDVAAIKIKAGDGGDGKVSFRREKFVPKGGPDGGDGGTGGCVYFVSNNNMVTLMDFRSKSIFRAESGRGGGKKKMSGGNGADLYVKVPVGTLIYENKGAREVLVCDMNEPDKVFMAARGGNGGKGNFRFRSSTNQVPYQYTAGGKGEAKEIKLEIKLVADVGLIGMPNAGKSTLINALTNSGAKVGEYPFTTLSPNLGVFKMKNGKDIVLADIPGLIEGASEGKGLGDEFLRHIERTRLLVHIVDPLPLDPNLDAVKKYKAIREELSQYGRGLSEKTEIVVVNKIDVTEVKEKVPELKKAFSKIKIIPVFISAATGEGTKELEDVLLGELGKTPEKVVFDAQGTIKLYTPDNLPNRKVIFGSQKVLIKEKK